MNRIRIACVLLIIVVVLSATALYLQYSATKALLTSFDELIAIYDSGDMARCHAAAVDLTGELEDRMRWFPFFLRHERMETVFQQTASLPYLIDDNDPADFMSAVASMRIQLEILLDNEWPTPENIM